MAMSSSTPCNSFRARGLDVVINELALPVPKVSPAARPPLFVAAEAEEKRYGPQGTTQQQYGRARSTMLCRRCPFADHTQALEASLWVRHFRPMGVVAARSAALQPKCLIETRPAHQKTRPGTDSRCCAGADGVGPGHPMGCEFVAFIRLGSASALLPGGTSGFGR